MEETLALGALEIEGHALLAPVPAQMHQVQPGELAGADRAQVVTVRRLLDLDHLRAEVGEMHAEEVGREERHLEHADAAEERVRQGFSVL